MQLLTPRPVQSAVGQCKYVLITNAEGGILNDLVLLRLAEDKFWLSPGGQRHPALGPGWRCTRV